MIQRRGRDTPRVHFNSPRALDPRWLWVAARTRLSDKKGVVPMLPTLRSTPAIVIVDESLDWGPCPCRKCRSEAVVTAAILT